MNKLKWLLISLALIFVIILTMPKSGYIDCNHQQVFSDDCHTSVCTKCGEIKHYENPQHDFVNTNCTNRICQNCSFSESGEFHTNSRVPCSDETVCTVCGHAGTYPAGEYHPNHVTTYSKGCLCTVSCEDCGKKLYSLTSHTWVSSNCSKEVHCADCGQDYLSLFGFSSTHMREQSFFGFFIFCSRCHRFIEFQLPNYLSIGALFGFLMSIAAFIFIFVKHKDISVQGGKYIRTATPEAYTRDREIHVENL